MKLLIDSSWRVFAISMIAAAVAFVVPACQTVSLPAGTESNVTVRMKADFDAAAASRVKGPAAAKSACPASPTSSDSPQYNAGEDCDGDGGVVRYATPSTYKVAVKRLSFELADGTLVDLIPDSGTLAKAEIVDMTQPVTVATDSLPSGTYSNVRAEIYYFELTLLMYDESNPQTIRVYLSDDDFDAEGNLGHHQGDITLIDDAGNELGFVGAGVAWQTASLTPTRGNVNGGGGTDAETGHLRGLFGDASLWNQNDFQQGSDQDIFVVNESLGLNLGAIDVVVTIAFNVKDTWFFEDFDGNSRFTPCATANGDACAANAEWAPLFAEPQPTVAEIAE